MSSTQKTDYIAMWFQARKELGIGDRMNVGLLSKADEQINWFEFAHSQMDGLGGLTSILREHGYPCADLPKAADKAAPSTWEQIKMLFAGTKSPVPKTILWKTTYPDYAASRLATQQYSNDAPIINGYFSQEQTKLIKKRARQHKVALNIYLFWALNRAVAEQLLDSQQQYYWLYPVNLRGALGDKEETGNCSSGINVLLNNTISAREIQLQVKQQIKLKTHWQLWWQAHIGKVIGMGGVRKLYQFVSERQFYAGSFSFLGNWPLADENNPPANDDDIWVCCGIGTKNYPVSTGILLWHNQLSLGLKLHPYIAKDSVITTSTMESWKQHLLQGDLLTAKLDSPKNDKNASSKDDSSKGETSKKENSNDKNNQDENSNDETNTNAAKSNLLEKLLQRSRVKLTPHVLKLREKATPYWQLARYKFIQHKKISIPLSIVFGTFLCITLLSIIRPQSQIKPDINRFPSVRYADVKLDDAVIPIFSRGVVSAKTQINLNSEVTARVKSIAVNFIPGGYFNSGDVLVKLDDEAYQLEVVKKQQAVDGALLHLAETKAKAHVARRGLSRKATSFAKHEPQIQDAESRVKAARADLRLANLKLERSVIKAPFAGRVKSVAIGQGQLVNSGEVIGEIFSLDKMLVRLPVADKYLALIDLPQHKTYTTNPNTDELTLPEVTLLVNLSGKTYQWQGHILGTEGGLAENRLQYVVAEVLNDPENPLYLQPGRFVKAVISGREFEQVVTIPRLALRNGNQVWLLDEQQRLQVVDVDVLHQGKELVYINTGLQAGDKLILTPLDVAVNGMKLNVVKANATGASS